ncbi:MAG: phosphate acyltransferase PlsX [Deltaproteobacteria bacterium]|nr:phosphate acyltransferase PlsX [Candidatus Anaeroferrophillus wilburensis]MBN2889034.1 phosphate acyltransferase PlsX [Deltaproteobacteria bacterium]
MRIAVDAMGGDNAPEEIVAGAVDAARDYNIHVILVGYRERIEHELQKHQIKNLPIYIQHASEVITMEDSPSKVLRRKKDSSLRVGIDLVRDGRAQGVISAGNSGAAMALAMFSLKKLEHIDRPAIVANLPTLKNSTVLLDVGGNVDCKPLHLAQFAVMGSVYATHILERTAPKVGLLSNGEESSKGNELTRETDALLRKSSLNYIGYIEGRDIYPGEIDVVVCDGFVGNIVLKTSEGLALAITDLLKRELSAGFTRKIGALLSKSALRNVKAKIDYTEYGGAPLLGVNGNCFICHGSSCRKAIKNAIRLSAEFAKQRVNDHLIEEMNKNQEIQKLLPKKKIWNQLKERIISKDRDEEDSE